MGMSRAAPGTSAPAKGQDRPKVLLKVMVWVPIVLKGAGGRLFVRLLWLKRLLSRGAMLGGGASQDVRGVLAVRVVRGARTAHPWQMERDVGNHA